MVSTCPREKPRIRTHAKQLPATRARAWRGGTSVCPPSAPAARMAPAAPQHARGWSVATLLLFEAQPNLGKCIVVMQSLAP